MEPRGGVIWITGLAGAGKTTLAEKVVGAMKSEGIHPVHVDGDVIRQLFGAHLGFDTVDRLANAFNIARACQWLSSQGLIVVCSTMSLYPEVWEWNRNNIERYLQIYLKVPFSILVNRNKKGLYRDVDAISQHVVGLGLEFHEPIDSDLVLVNGTAEDLNVNVDRVMTAASRLLN